MYTKLGENLESLDEADAVADHYIAVLDAIKARGLRRRDLGQADPARAGPRRGPGAGPPHAPGRPRRRDRLLRLDRHGGQRLHRGDASSCTSALRAVEPRTGICLQAYLRRTAADIERLRPLDPAIRLVKGAYDEPASIAYRDKRQVDANYLALAVDFLTKGRGRPIRLGLGTHDVALIEQIAAAGRAGRHRARRVRDRDAVRDPDRGAVPARQGRAIASRRSSPTGMPGIRGTCAGSPSGRPT